MTPEQLAKAYVDTLNSQPNGWGQHVHPTLGVSHSILRQVYIAAGSQEAGIALIDAEFNSRKAANAPRK